jgi:hypothetical protein
MTVVARLAINAYPMLIGDLLLSIEDPLALPSPLPTAEDLSALFPVGSACVPCGLRQKVAVVSDNLVVGWSGALSTAGRVIADLKRKSQSRLFTSETLTKHFDGLSPSVWDEIGLVAILEETKDRVFYWGRKSRELDTNLFGQVGLLGSGSDTVGKMLLCIPRLPVGLDRTLEGPEQALGFCLQMTGNLMQLEIATRKSLADFYGGGYEIATCMDDKYRKVDDITYLFWHARIEHNEVLFASAPYKAFRYAYDNDLLVIRSVIFEDRQDLPVVTDQKLFCAEPVYRDAAPAEIAAIKPPTLNSRHLCVYFLLPIGKGIAVLAAVHRKSHPTDKKWVTFTETPAGITGIAVEQAFLQEIALQVRASGPMRSRTP